MLENLARALHVNYVTFFSLLFGTLIISSLLLGFALNRVLHYWAKRLHNSWAQTLFYLLASLSIPALLIAGLYLGLEALPLPPRFEYIGSRVIFALAILVMMYFPAQVIVLSLRRWGKQDPTMLRVTQPAAFVVRVLFTAISEPSSFSRTWASA